MRESEPVSQSVASQSGGPPTHVDRIARNPLSSSLRDVKLLGRYPSKDDPAIGAQERDGWATYTYINEPHTMADCLFGDDGYLKEMG